MTMTKKPNVVLVACFSAALGLTSGLANAGSTRDARGGHNFGNHNLGSRSNLSGHGNLGGSHGSSSPHTSGHEYTGSRGTISHTTTVSNNNLSKTTTITTPTASATHASQTVIKDRDSYAHGSSSTITKADGSSVYSGKTTFVEGNDLRSLTHNGSANIANKGISHEGESSIQAIRTGRTVSHNGSITTQNAIHEGSTTIDRYSDNPIFEHSGSTQIIKK